MKQTVHGEVLTTDEVMEILEEEERKERENLRKAACREGQREGTERHRKGSREDEES